MRALAAALLATVVGAVLPWQQASAETVEDCGKLGGTTRDLDLCFNRVYQHADAEMDALYRQLNGSLGDSGERSLLQEAEQAWVQYRDKTCAFETAGTRNGTIHPIVVSVCLSEKTQAHIEELRRQLNCSDGDTGCVHERRQ